LFGGGMRMYFQSGAVVTNSILWNNQAKAGPAAFIDLGAELSISHSDVEGGKGKIFVFSGGTLDWGAGMIDADPLFVDAGKGDFHLLYTSPCRDAGDGGAPALPAEDFEADPRLAGGAADLGADEFHPHLYYTGEAVPGGSIEIKITGTPGTAPLRLWAGSGLLDPPLPTPYGDWYLDFPLIFDAAFGAIPSPDGVRVLPLTLPSTTPVPLSIPMQALVGNALVNHALMNIE
jgi:hypothetical protein